MKTCLRIAPAVVVAWMFLAGTAAPGLATESDSLQATESGFAVDPDLPLDELELLIKPLSKAELVDLAEDWIALLRQKETQIVRAQIAIKQRERKLVTEDEATPATTEETAAMDSSGQQKAELLQQINEQREERTLIRDHLEAIFVELKKKTPEGDAETLARVQEWELYMRAAAGLVVDVTDATSTWATIQGWLTSEQGGLRWGRNLVMFLGILIAAWLLSAILTRVVRRALSVVGRMSHLLEDFLVRSVRWVVMAIGLIMALAALEISVGPLLAVVGAAGFVLAFALQDSLSNFASGLMILFFRPFDVGDVVEAGGVMGKVTSMNLVSTTVKTFDNKNMLIPNNKVWNDVITNATAVNTRRVDLEFGIGYSDDIDKAQAVLEQVVQEHPKTLDDPAPTIRVHALADSSVNFICRPWTRTADYWDVYWDLTKTVKQRFDAEGIGIPFPQRDVHVHLANGHAEGALAGLATGSSQSTNPKEHSAGS